MIPCQRPLFDIPEDVAYFNCAYTAPLLRAAQAAGQTAMKAKAAPWTITPPDFFVTTESVRKLFAQLIGCPADRIALIPAVSYGIALAAQNLPLARGQAIVVLAEQFPSNIYSWQRLADRKQARITTVSRPVDCDWTPAVLQAIDDQTAIAALPNCHWTDGTLLDLVRIAEKCRAVGAALVVDGTQSLGAMPFSIAAVQPDFLVTTAHKWLLGPYSFGFCYVAPRWQSGIPLEENWLNRAGSEDFARLVDYRHDYQPGARRFDVGEVSNFILAPVAQIALRQLLDWQVAKTAETLRAKTGAIADRAVQLGLDVAPAATRGPHMLGLSMPGGLAAELSARLAREKVYVSVRGDSIRISPHLYNNDADLERFLTVLEKVIPGKQATGPSPIRPVK
ncbi:MAG: aminotransferase class V-fold PLP-dependent enzyme [Desulfobacterales bacterium]|nr:MAG: aminotransferase class V-fold PLP-dependent enzyme [Desulfobacterales bacterium]